MCGTAMRGADALPGSKATSRAKGSHRKLGDLGSGHRCRVGAEYDGPHREDEESKPMMHGHEKSDLAIVAGKSANHVAPRCGAIRGGVSRSGVDGAKGGDQGECEPAKHVPGAEPDKRVTGAGTHTAICRHTPEVGAVCGKAARTVLCGGRAMKRTSLPLQRREFITLLGGAAAAWPLAARAQQERMRRIGVLLPATADDPQRQAWFGAFLQGLAQSDWIIGRNVQIDTRWATANADAVRRHAAELAALAPDVILATGASTVGPLLQATRTVPIVFAAVADPVGAGFVNSLAQPGGNTTGFMAF